MLLALDPGMNSPGVALFGDKTLLAADRVRVPTDVAEKQAGDRWLTVATYICAWVARTTGDASTVSDIVFEKPQWYQRSKSKGDPNDLVGVAGVAAALCGKLSGYRTHGLLGNVWSPTPADWIGQLPKICPVCHGKAKKKCAECHGSAWETPRGRRIRSRLNASELALVPDQNDAIDAVGLGLFQLGRLNPKTVFSNGRDGK